MPLSTSYKNASADAKTPALMKLHNGDPGAAGANNEIAGGGYAPVACGFDAAAAGVRALSANVSFTATALQAVTHATIWTAGGAEFLGSFALTGDAAFNAAGEYTVLAAGSSISITDA